MDFFKKGLLVSFEGTEGSGKSTLIQEVFLMLKKKGYQVIQTREPGGSPLAEKIRKILLHSSMDPKTELFLYEAARTEHLATSIRPALLEGAIVLCDRFTDSTLAYQAHARGLPWKEVKALNQIATSGLDPDLTFFLDIPPEIGLKRAQNPNRFEAEGLRFQKKVRLGYLKARAEHPKRWITLKASHQSPKEMAQSVVTTLTQRFRIQPFPPARVS